VVLAGCNGAAPGDDTSSSTATPIDAAERYYTADSEGDVEGINNVLHPESYNYPVENSEEENISIENTEQATIREATRWQSGLSGVAASGDDLDALVSEQETAIDELVSTIDVEDYTFVAVTTSTDGEEQTNYWLVVQDDSEWKIYVSSDYPFSFA
jgi:hypothetical protein